MGEAAGHRSAAGSLRYRADRGRRGHPAHAEGGRHGALEAARRRAWGGGAKAGSPGALGGHGRRGRYYDVSIVCRVAVGLRMGGKIGVAGGAKPLPAATVDAGGKKTYGRTAGVRGPGPGADPTRDGFGWRLVDAGRRATLRPYQVGQA